MNKALFLDLDGTVISTASGRTFPLHIKDWKINKEIIPVIKNCIKHNYIIIIVTNQGGIECGYITEANFLAKIEDVCNTLEKILKTSVKIHYLYCKHMESYYRKPNIGMGVEAALEYELDLKNSIMVGDMNSDKEFASNLNMAYISMEKVKADFNAQGL